MKCPHCHKPITLPTLDRISLEKELDKVDHEVKIIRSNYADNQAWCLDDRQKIKPLLARRKFLREALGRIV